MPPRKERRHRPADRAGNGGLATTLRRTANRLTPSRNSSRLKRVTRAVFPTPPCPISTILRPGRGGRGREAEGETARARAWMTGEPLSSDQSHQAAPRLPGNAPTTLPPWRGSLDCVGGGSHLSLRGCERPDSQRWTAPVRSGRTTRPRDKGRRAMRRRPAAGQRGMQAKHNTPEPGNTTCRPHTPRACLRCSSTTRASFTTGCRL